MEGCIDVSNLLGAKHLIAGLRWLNAMAAEDKWNLSHAEKLTLLGNVSDVEFNSLQELDKTCELTKLAESALERLVILIGIERNLNALVSSEHSYKAFKHKNSNSIFNGQSLKDFLLNSESVDSYYVVLRYLENAMY